jgi:four helix bundle protein
MSIVLKELKESRFWLKLIRRTRMLTPQYTDPIINECEQLCAIVAKSIITAKKRRISGLSVLSKNVLLLI